MQQSNIIEKIKIRTLYLFVFLLCFQKLRLFNSPYLNFTWVGYFSYFFANLLTIKKSFALDKDILKYLIPISIYWCLVVIMNYINYEPDTELIYAEIRQELMGIALLWMMLNHIKNNVDLHKKLLYYFIFSIATLVFLYVIGIQVSYSDEGRISILGINSNEIALWSGIAILILINELVNIKNTKNIFLNNKISIVLLIIFLFFIIAKTGSRGGLISFSFGYIVYFIAVNKTLKTKLIILIISTFIGVIGINLIINSSVMKNRIDTQKQDQSLGGRMPIWETTIDMINENPLFGVGPGKYEMRFREKGGFVNTHNEYLTILVYTGFLGLLNILVFFFQLLKGIIKSKNKMYSPLMYSLFLMYIIYLTNAGGSLPALTTWFLFGIIATHGNISRFKKKPQRYNVTNYNKPNIII